SSPQGREMGTSVAEQEGPPAPGGLSRRARKLGLVGAARFRALPRQGEKIAPLRPLHGKEAPMAPLDPLDRTADYGGAAPAEKPKPHKGRDEEDTGGGHRDRGRDSANAEIQRRRAGGAKLEQETVDRTQICVTRKGTERQERIEVGERRGHCDDARRRR